MNDLNKKLNIKRILPHRLLKKGKPKKKKYIYTVTCLRGIPTYCLPKSQWPKSEKERNKVNRHRCFGWFSNLKKAKDYIDLDGRFLRDQQYDLLVIERIPEAICGISIPKEWWFKWEGDDEGKFVPIDKPEELNHTICFGMG
jgi:hypothetical protein